MRTDLLFTNGSVRWGCGCFTGGMLCNKLVMPAQEPPSDPGRFGLPIGDAQICSLGVARAVKARAVGRSGLTCEAFRLALKAGINADEGSGDDVDGGCGCLGRWRFGFHGGVSFDATSANGAGVGLRQQSIRRVILSCGSYAPCVTTA